MSQRSSFTKELNLKFSAHLRHFDVTTYPEAALAAMRHFDQEGMLCYPFRVGSDTIYKFQFKEPVEIVATAWSLTVVGRLISFPVIIGSQGSRRNERRKGYC